MNVGHAITRSMKWQRTRDRHSLMLHEQYTRLLMIRPAIEAHLDNLEMDADEDRELVAKLRGMWHWAWDGNPAHIVP